MRFQEQNMVTKVCATSSIARCSCNVYPFFISVKITMCYIVECIVMMNMVSRRCGEGGLETPSGIRAPSNVNVSKSCYERNQGKREHWAT